MHSRLILFAAAYCAVVAVFLLFGPVSTRRTIRDGEVVRVERGGILEGQPRQALLLVSVPVGLALTPLAFRNRTARKRASAVVAAMLAAFGLLGAASIGVFYLPAAGMLALAARDSPRL